MSHAIGSIFFKEITDLMQGIAAAAKLLQSYPTLCDPIDSSPPGSPVSGILQARTLEWVAISFSNAWKWKVKVKSLGRVWLLVTPQTAAYQAPLSMRFFQARVLEWGAIAFSRIYIYIYFFFFLTLFFIPWWKNFLFDVKISKLLTPRIIVFRAKIFWGSYVVVGLLWWLR